MDEGLEVMPAERSNAKAKHPLLRTGALKNVTVWHLASTTGNYGSYYDLFM
jgi:hypothetical protein